MTRVYKDQEINKLEILIRQIDIEISQLNMEHCLKVNKLMITRRNTYLKLEEITQNKKEIL